jgi:hypothetical protein
MNIFSHFFKKESKPQQSESSNTYLDILISLNKDMQIDLSVFIDCDYKKYNISLIDYIYMCSKIINFDSNKIKNQIIEILNDQIKNSDNEELISKLVFVLKTQIQSQESILPKNNNDFFIKPSQVFMKHIHEHQ